MNLSVKKSFLESKAPIFSFK